MSPPAATRTADGGLRSQLRSRSPQSEEPRDRKAHAHPFPEVIILSPARRHHRVVRQKERTTHGRDRRARQTGGVAEPRPVGGRSRRLVHLSEARTSSSSAFPARSATPWTRESRSCRPPCFGLLCAGLRVSASPR